MASPSRSGSVASRTAVLPRASSFKRLTTSLRSLGMTYCGWKACSMSTPSLLVGKSRTWPRQARTVKPRPRNFSMVLALAADSTTTRLCLAMCIYLVLPELSGRSLPHTSAISGPGIQHRAYLARQSAQFEQRQGGRDIAGPEGQCACQIIYVAGFTPQRVPHRTLLRAKLRHVACHRRPSLALARSGPESVEDILSAGHRRRTLFQQLVRASAHWIQNAAGHDHHLAALFERKVGGDQRATPFARFDDDRSQRQAGDDPIASRKVDRIRRDARRKF